VPPIDGENIHNVHLIIGVTVSVIAVSRTLGNIEFLGS
jgi:hypothetical protein